MSFRCFLGIVLGLFVAACDSKNPPSLNQGTNLPALGEAIVETPSLDLSLNYLVMAEDSQTETISRREQLSQKILAGVSANLAQAGLLVFDEEVITLDSYLQGRSRRPNEELIDIARSVRNPLINRVVFVSMERHLNPGTQFDRASIRLNARVLNVQSGQQIGAAELSTVPLTLPKGCLQDNQCVRTALHQNPQKWGRDFADVIRAEVLN